MHDRLWPAIRQRSIVLRCTLAAGWLCARIRPLSAGDFPVSFISPLPFRARFRFDGRGREGLPDDSANCAESVQLSSSHRLDEDVSDGGRFAGTRDDAPARAIRYKLIEHRVF